MRALSKRIMRIAKKGTPDVIHRTSPETGQLMLHLGDNTYMDVSTKKVYKSKASVADQTKQDQLLYPLSA